MRPTATLSGSEAVLKKLNRMADPPKEADGVKVGIVKTARYPTETIFGRQQQTNPPTVAQVAFWNEFGTRGGGWGGPIPERPFMRDSVERFKNDVQVKELLASIIETDDPVFRREQAELLGVLLKGLMQEQITEGDYEPNAPSTVRIKTKGKGGITTPLIDTGLMRRSIDYEVTP